jgi:hypothetical protein
LGIPPKLHKSSLACSLSRPFSLGIPLEKYQLRDTQTEYVPWTPGRALIVNNGLSLSRRCACTSLCNRQLFAIFHLRNDPIPLIGRDKLPFLTRLGRDLPSFFVCYQCYVLHRYYASKGFLPGPLFQVSLSCLSKSLEFSDQPWTHHVSHDSEIVFDFLHLQLAMRRFYYGSEYGISTEDILVHKFDFTLLNLALRSPYFLPSMHRYALRLLV